MTNQDIETFFAVLDHGTMTAAAEALYITQPVPVRPAEVAGGPGGRASVPPGARPGAASP